MRAVSPNEPARSVWRCCFGAVVALALACWRSAAHADENAAAPLSTGFRFTESTGEELFANVCQGCHMPDGEGAIGAGTYPSLVATTAISRPAAIRFIVVVSGQRAMPPFGDMMSDDQVAAVVNYVRTHFGNQLQGRGDGRRTSSASAARADAPRRRRR